MSAGIKIQLSHGHEKHEIYLESENCTVEELRTNIENVTGVPVINQKLIFKGKSLSTPEDKLSLLGIVNNSKMMLIGRKFNDKDEGCMRSMKEVENKLMKIEVNMAEVNKQYVDVKNGFLPSNLRLEAVTQMKKEVLDIIDHFEKLLKPLDTMVLLDSPTEVKATRKTLVRKILDSLKKAEDLQVCLEKLVT